MLRPLYTIRYFSFIGDTIKYTFSLKERILSFRRDQEPVYRSLNRASAEIIFHFGSIAFAIKQLLMLTFKVDGAR